MLECLAAQGGKKCNTIEELLLVTEAIQKNGHPVVLVISGAVGMGKLDEQLTSFQAQAARGQLQLTTELGSRAPKNMKLALLLLSRKDIVNRKRYLTLQDTFAELFTAGIVPLINENDATTIKGKTDFPDNDHLAAILAISLNAESLFLLTNVDGVYSAHPDEEGAELYEEVTNVNLELLQAMGNKQAGVSRGGMIGKLQAARLATSAGIATHILNGNSPKHISDILAGKHFGTHCKPRTHESVVLTNRDRWVISAKGSDGTIQLDEGAANAVGKRKSLLAVGVHSIYGEFQAGDSVEIVDHKKETIAIGLVNQSSQDLQAILAKKDKPYGIEVVHADNIILI